MTMAAIYGCGSFYPGSDGVAGKLKRTGFTTVVPSSISVFPRGDLYWAANSIVQNGKYIGDPNWQNFLGGLKEGPTQVTRILLSVGGWDHLDFTHVHDLIFAAPGSYPNKPDIGPDSILYKNFKALKDLQSSNGTQAIDAIDLDDEESVDTPTIVAFSKMLYAIGFSVTFCVFDPETRHNWVDALSQLNVKGQAQIVTGFNLMTYSGISGDDPKDWIAAIQAKMGPKFDAAGFVFPGLANRWYDQTISGCNGMCPSTVQNSFKGWKSAGIKGGFIYNYDRIGANSGVTDCKSNPHPTDYAHAIVAGLQGESSAAEQFASTATT